MTAELSILNKKENINELYGKFSELNFIFEKINAYSNDMIFILNNKKQIISCSKKVRTLFSNQNIVGENFFNLINKIIYLPDDFFREKNYFVKMKGENSDKILEANIEKYSEISEQTNRYIVILKDITEKKEMQAQKDNFIATLTHDLKTPVRADILSLELLLKGHFGKLQPEQTEILSEILNSNKFMMNMLDTLLAKYKYESEGVQLSKSIFNLNEFIETITKELHCLFAEKNISYKFNFSDKDFKINADKLELKRAFSNIISNAIKFNKENGFVQISIKENGNNAEIIVEDTGIGMNKEKIQHIFDKYVSYAKRFRQLGTGLGLYVAKKIIEAHNGKIEVSSIPNEGSAFTISLPTDINKEKAKI